jgi:hypothetical protein
VLSRLSARAWDGEMLVHLRQGLYLYAHTLHFFEGLAACQVETRAVHAFHTTRTTL